MEQSMVSRDPFNACFFDESATTESYTYCHTLSLLDALPISLVVWLIKRDDMPFVDDQGKEALNFNITVFIVCVALRSDEHTSELQSLMRSSYAVFCLNNIITC